MTARSQKPLSQVTYSNAHHSHPMTVTISNCSVTGPINNFWARIIPTNPLEPQARVLKRKFTPRSHQHLFQVACHALSPDLSFTKKDHFFESTVFSCSTRRTKRLENETTTLCQGIKVSIHSLLFLLTAIISERFREVDHADAR